MSGSGKTTVGKVLARRLGWRFVDTDSRIRRRSGRTVQQIFQEQGEPRFRAIESEVVREACAGVRQVIATGGGAPVRAENRSSMLAGNLVVFLDSAPETLVERLTRSIEREPRPMLAGGDLLGRLTELRRERDAHYRCAHHVIQTDGHTPREVADVIAELVRVRRR